MGAFHVFKIGTTNGTKLRKTSYIWFLKKKHKTFHLLLKIVIDQEI